MNYLVLGSSGQIGASLVQYIQKTGNNALLFDLSQSSEEDLRLPQNKILSERMQKADFVFFLAFDVGGSRYLKAYQHTFEFLSNNIRIMEYSFEMLQQTQKPFLFASSQMSNMNYSPYGQLKALGELYTRVLNGIIVKFWNVYGIERDLTKAHVITDFLLMAKNNQSIKMLTDGSELRQFLFADDCSECLMQLASQHKNISRNEELHITSFEWNSVMDIANIVAACYPGTKILPAKLKDNVQKDKRNEPNSYVLSFWKPKTSLAQGIQLIKDSLLEASR